MWKRTVSAEFWVDRSKLSGNWAFSQNFHTRKLGKITVFYVVPVWARGHPLQHITLREKLLHMLIVIKTITIYVHTNNDDENNNNSFANPPGIFLLYVNNRNTEQCSKFGSKSTINSPEQRHGRYFAIYIVYREQISHSALTLLLMT